MTTDTATEQALEMLTDLLQGLECATAIEKMVMAGMEPHMKEWERVVASHERAPPELTRLIREQLSSKSNIRRNERQCEALRIAIQAIQDGRKD